MINNMNASTITTLGVVLIVLGMLVVFLGVMISSKNAETQVKGGGIVFLGPIPIIFGTDRGSTLFVSILGLILILAAYSFLKK